MSSTITNPAVASGPVTGPSHVGKPHKLATCSDRTTTGAGRRALAACQPCPLPPGSLRASSGLFDRPSPDHAADFDGLLQDVVAKARKVAPPAPSPDSRAPTTPRRARANVSDTVRRTAGTRPIHRWSRDTAGARTNVRRTASAIGIRRVWAQYKTTITSTKPAKVTHGRIVFSASYMVPAFSEHFTCQK